LARDSGRVPAAAIGGLLTLGLDDGHRWQKWLIWSAPEEPYLKRKIRDAQGFFGWARLVSNQRPLACEAVAPQARIGVIQRLWMCADVCGYGHRTALVPVADLCALSGKRLLFDE